MRVIFKGEEKRRQESLAREASLIHRASLDHLDESEDGRWSVHPDEALLEELLKSEEEEISALISLREHETQDSEMEDVVLSDVHMA